MDILSGIAAVSSALDIAKSLRGIEKSYDSATYRAQMAELIETLTDAKLALADAKENLFEKDKEIEILRRNFEMKSSLAQGEGVYNYLADKQGNPVGYPFCPKYEQIEGRIVQRKEHEHSGKSRRPACNTVYSPVFCHLESGSGYKAKQDREPAQYNAVIENRSQNIYYQNLRLASSQSALPNECG